MVGFESFQRRAQDAADRQAQGVGGFPNFLLKIVGDGAREMQGTVPEGIGTDVPAEKIGEAFPEQGLYFRSLTMLAQERGQTRQEAVGQRLSVNFLQDIGGLQVIGFQQRLAQVVGQLPLQAVADQSLSQDGATAFIAQNIA